MISKAKISLVLILTICSVILLSGCSNDPCSNVTCPDICHGNELWSQVCKDGNCIDYKRVSECSSYCKCIENPKTNLSTNPPINDPCSKISCGTICVGNELWYSKCVNGECVKDIVFNKCSDKCGCDPYYFSEIRQDTTFISPDGLYGQFTFKEGDIIRVIMTCRKSSCTEPPSYYYQFIGNRSIRDRIEYKLDPVTGLLKPPDDVEYGTIETPNEWHIKKSGNYVIYVTNEYYLQVGYLIEK